MRSGRPASCSRRRDSDAQSSSATLNAILFEELAVADAAFAIAAAAPIGFLSAIAAQGSPAQKKNSAAALRAATSIDARAVAIMEPDFAFDVLRDSHHRDQNARRISSQRCQRTGSARGAMQSFPGHSAMRWYARGIHRRARRQGCQRRREETQHRSARARNRHCEFQRRRVSTSARALESRRDAMCNASSIRAAPR